MPVCNLVQRLVPIRRGYRHRHDNGVFGRLDGGVPEDYDDGEEGVGYTRLICGSQLEAEPMASWALGTAAAERRELITKLAADAVKQGSPQQKELF
jgi:hypothetical protein